MADLNDRGVGGGDRSFTTAIWPLRSTVSMGSRIPSSKACDAKVAAAYAVGVITGSRPRRDLRSRGVDAEISVGSVECRKVTGAIDAGSAQEPRDLMVDKVEREPFVEGVRSNLVLAMSSGARTSPAIPEADTETSKERRGDVEERTSSRAREEGEGSEDRVVCVGSGRASIAQRKDLMKDAMVEKSTLCQNVLFVPFQTPQAPSSLHS